MLSVPLVEQHIYHVTISASKTKRTVETTHWHKMMMMETVETSQTKASVNHNLQPKTAM